MFLLGFFFFFFFKLTFCCFPLTPLRHVSVPLFLPPLFSLDLTEAHSDMALAPLQMALAPLHYLLAAPTPLSTPVVCPNAYVSPIYLDGRDRSPALKSFISQSHFLYFAEVLMFTPVRQLPDVFNSCSAILSSAERLLYTSY